MSARDRILERRARFVSTALVLAAGCSREQTPATRAPEKDVVPAVTAQPASSVKPPKDRPPLEAKVSDGGVEHRDQAVARIEKTHAAVSKLASSVPPPCPLEHADCKAKFAAFADEWARLEDDLLSFLPRCPAKTPDDKAVEAMLTAHRNWLGEWLKAIDEAGRIAAGDAGTAWNELREKAIDAHPQPCLKYYCP